MSYDIGKSIVISGSTTAITRRIKTAYKSFDINKSTNIKGGTNYYENLNTQFFDNALYPHGPSDTDASSSVPANYLFVGIEDIDLIEKQPTSSVNEKTKYHFSTIHGRDYSSSSLSYGEVLKTNIAIPANFISGNLIDGYQSQVSSEFMSGVIITNIHHDSYGPNNETPIQGPFTNAWVGGRQSRHVPINQGNDSYITRPEAWKMVFGTGSFSGSYEAAFGFIGADYPYPEGNSGEPSFPVLVHKRATYFRDEYSKRPVNIRNIITTTGSIEHGNYKKSYEIAATAGRTNNNRLLRQSVLEGTNTDATELSGVVRVLGGVTAGRIDYMLPERSGSDSIVGSRFSAPGGSRYTSRGFLNNYAEEFSPYNALPFRNREIIGDASGNGITNSSYIVSGAAGTGSLHALSRHAERFGYDSGSSTIPSPHKINRNTSYRVKSENLSQTYDNYYVSRQIPQKDTGYSWIASSLASSSVSASWENYRHADGNQFKESNILTSSILGIKTGSAPSEGYAIPLDFVGLNTIIVEGTSSTNTIGTSSIQYITSSLVSSVPTTENLFNAMLVHRNGAFGAASFKQLAYQRNDKIAQYLRNNNLIQNLDSDENIVTYTEPAIDDSNYPILVEAYIDDVSVTKNSDRYDVSFTYDNMNTTFSNIDLKRSLNLLQFKNKEMDEILNNSIVSKTIDGFDYQPYKITYKKRIFPISSNPQRKRTSFIHSYWRDEQSDRTENSKKFLGITLPTSSIWPLDSRINYSTTSASFSDAYVTSSTEGILQNMYSQATGSAFSVVGFPLYFYKQSLPTIASVRARSGLNSTTLPVPSGEIASKALFANSTKWQVSDDTGYKPFEDNYEIWLGDMHRQNKGYSVLPEYRISSKIPSLIENNFSVASLDENYIEITGASIFASTSSNDIAGAKYVEDILNNNSKIYSPPKITIKLTCETVEKFLPYNGFYPVQRTLDIVDAFSGSYMNYVSLVSGADALSTSDSEFMSHYRTMIEPLFAPGILYNTIKSGIAVDYPILTSSLTISKHLYDNTYTSESYQIGNDNFDVRLPFESILNPTKHLNGIRIIDANPHPSVHLPSTASLYGVKDENYTLMINNFFAETVNLFLKNRTPSSIRSKPVSSVKAESGKKYQAILKIFKTTKDAVKKIAPNINGETGDYPRPQFSNTTEENITMFSNPLGFGPPCGGGSHQYTLTYYTSGSKDASNGYNSPFTPPYYDGESWAIIEFSPAESKTFTIDEIVGSSSVKYIRYEFDAEGGFFDYDNDGYTEIQGSRNMNNNAMQLSASVNLFNIVDSKDFTPELNAAGGLISKKADSTKNKKSWEISSKFETPILNFNPNSTGYTVQQTNVTASDYGLANAGMWLQYGSIPASGEGIFMQIIDVPESYKRYGTYGNRGAVTSASYFYNEDEGINVSDIKSLVDLVGFSTEPVRMGEIADNRVLKEAIIAIPYTISTVTNERQFIKLDKKQVENFLNGKESSLSLTVKEQLSKLQDYVLPLHLDYINNNSVQPISMYVFEIEKQINQNDISNIWQNVAPQSLNTVENGKYTITHTLEDNELLNSLNVDNNRTINFMCFKVKQRAITKYEFSNYDDDEDNANNKEVSNKKVLKQAKNKLKFNPANEIKNNTIQNGMNKDIVGYNWPYDFFSLVESAKIDATVEFSNFNETTNQFIASGSNASEVGDTIVEQTNFTKTIKRIGISG